MMKIPVTDFDPLHEDCPFGFLDKDGTLLCGVPFAVMRGDPCCAVDGFAECPYLCPYDCEENKKSRKEVMLGEYTFEYAVSFARQSGLGSVGLDGKWFKDYDSAYKYAQRWECPFTVYFVVNRKWVFYCERSSVENEPYVLYNIRSLPGHVGQVETKIWWSTFISEPEKFLDYAEEVLDNT